MSEQVITQGRRLPDGPMKLGDFHRGDYKKVLYDDGTMHWYALLPSCDLALLDGHSVTEHEDGTITVSPSILMTMGSTQLWHGYLERGAWREV